MTFNQAATLYAGLCPSMPLQENTIRNFCNAVRVIVNAGNPATVSEVSQLVFHNAVAYANRGEILTFRNARKMPALPKTAFVALLDKMLTAARGSSRISHTQYKEWKDEFFDEAGFHAEVVFNRMVFTLFPEQFCSVSKPNRLREVAIQLTKDLVISPKTAGNLRGGDWFTECTSIMPIIRSGFSTRDFAYCSAFLGAMGVVISR